MHFKEFQNHIFPFKDRIYRLARWMMNHNEEAEDVVQEIFLKLWVKRNELDKYNSVEAFIMRMTKNLCLDKLKSKVNSTSVDMKDHFQDNSPSPLRKTEMTDTMAILKTIISKLPHQQRLVMQLRTIEGYNNNEITEITGMSANNIRVMLSRARKSVRESYKQQIDYVQGNN